MNYPLDERMSRSSLLLALFRVRLSQVSLMWTTYYSNVVYEMMMILG